MSRVYANMEYQRKDANRSKTCNLCGGKRIREMRPWPKPNDAYYRGAVCPKCDVGEKP